MSAEFNTRTCPRCGLAMGRATRGLLLCAACGSVTPVEAAPPPAEPWMLEWQAREYRAALEEPVIPRRTLLLRGAGVVALVVTVIVTGVTLAFLAYGRVNLRYVGTLAVLLTAIGVATLAALAWAAGDPNTPLKDRYRRRLADAERALDRDGTEENNL